MKQIDKNILSWCDDIDPIALKQVKNLAQHPCIMGNVCLMPDAHAGFGMPIGGVAALDNAVSPNMVGVDIGCGMLAVKTSLTNIKKDKLAAIVNKIVAKVPTGFSHHETPQESAIFNHPSWDKTEVCKREFASAKKQIGTLGGGNHFIEIQKGDDGHIWFMIHSGSRNLGKQVAEYYNKLAVKMCGLYRQNQVIEHELAFLPVGTKEAGAYILEMKLCLEFSYANRAKMAERIKESFNEVVPGTEFPQEINIHHNYAENETHFGKQVWVHRKGATFAGKNTVGIIPGSQGTASYIVQGLGNKASMYSCSHGAGRKMSRSRAVQNLSLEQEQDFLNKQGIIHCLKNKEDLDEASGAYKDIDAVIAQEEDLIKVLVKLMPLAVIKGSNKKLWGKR